MSQIDSKLASEGAASRVPLRSHERLYHGYGSFFWTCTAFSAATFAFLIGSFLPYTWDARIGAAGYLCGLLIGFAIVLVAAGMAPYRYGVDTIDSAKAAFGPFGVILPLLGLLATCIGWSYVLLAFTAKGAAHMVGMVTPGVATSDMVVTTCGVAAIAAVWLGARKGPAFFQRLSALIAPVQLVIAVAVLGFLLHRYGAGLWTMQVDPAQRLASTPIEGFALAVEYGVSNAFTWWPLMGGLTRLVAKRSNVTGPILLGGGVLGAAFIAMVSAFASLAIGVPDPVIWMVQLCGPNLGAVMILSLLVANVATVVIFLYLAGVSIQQIRSLARLRWEVLVAIMLLPGLYFVYRTEWTLSAVMNWLSYNGILFVGVTAVTLVDYILLRWEQLDVPHLFVRTDASAYWFWGGVNWVAIAVSLAAVPLDIWLVDPLTLHAHSIGHWLGAGIPTLVTSAILYYVVMKAFVMPRDIGHYRMTGRFSRNVSPTL